MATASPRRARRARWPSLSAGTRIQPSAWASACIDRYPCATGSTLPSRRRTATTSARPSGEAILRASSAANGCSSIRRKARRASMRRPTVSQPASAASIRPGSSSTGRVPTNPSAVVSPGVMPMPWNCDLADAGERAHALVVAPAAGAADGDDHVGARRRSARLRASMSSVTAMPLSTSMALAISVAAPRMMSPAPARTTRTRGWRTSTRSTPSAVSSATSIRRRRAPASRNCRPAAASAFGASTPSPGATAASA